MSVSPLSYISLCSTGYRQARHYTRFMLEIKIAEAIIFLIGLIFIVEYNLVRG